MQRDSCPLVTKRLTARVLTLALTCAVTLGLMLSLGGCNTMHGLGKDVEEAGEAIQKSAK
jgi:predicted small secreted protein